MTSHLLPSAFRAVYFPRLTDANHQITSPQDPDYNCVAWAANDVEARWWPGAGPEFYWPDDVSDEETIAAFSEMFTQSGYEVCDSVGVEAGYEKIAIYADDDAPTHVARQVENGQWTSKLGPREDIQHETLADLHSRHYGRVRLIMRRRREQED